MGHFPRHNIKHLRSLCRGLNRHRVFIRGEDEARRAKSGFDGFGIPVDSFAINRIDDQFRSVSKYEIIAPRRKGRTERRSSELFPPSSLSLGAAREAWSKGCAFCVSNW